MGRNSWGKYAREGMDTRFLAKVGQLNGIGIFGSFISSAIYWISSRNLLPYASLSKQINKQTNATNKCNNYHMIEHTHFPRGSCQIGNM